MEWLWGGAFEKVKKTVQEKWEGFKKKFESVKSEMSQEVLSAKTPDDMIATGKKLQEQGEALKMEEESVKQEEMDEARDEADAENVKFNERKSGEKAEAERDEAIEMNKDFDKAKIAEEKAKENAKIAEEARLSAEADAAKAAELLEKIKSGKLGTAPEEKGEAMKVENAEHGNKSFEEKENILTPKQVIQKGKEFLRDLNREFNKTRKETNEDRRKLSALLSKKGEWKSDNEIDVVKLEEIIKNNGRYEEKLLSETEKTEKSEKADQLLKSLFIDGRNGEMDPFLNRVSEEQMERAEEFITASRGLDQSTLAQKFFDDTIGRNISNNEGAYMVYKLLKGTEFSSKFKELESARLKSAGFGEFTL